MIIRSTRQTSFQLHSLVDHYFDSFCDVVLPLVALSLGVLSLLIQGLECFSLGSDGRGEVSLFPVEDLDHLLEDEGTVFFVELEVEVSVYGGKYFVWLFCTAMSPLLIS